MEEKTLEEERRFSTSIEQIAFNIDLLNYKLSRLEQIDVHLKENQFEYLTVFDSAVVQVRAMLLEKGKKNYTFQNYFKEIGKPDIAQEIDAYLDTPFDGHDDISIRTALKFLSDKFICHLDEITATDLGNINYIMATLSNTYSEYSLKDILGRIRNIIGNGI